MLHEYMLVCHTQICGRGKPASPEFSHLYVTGAPDDKHAGGEDHHGNDRHTHTLQSDCDSQQCFLNRKTTLAHIETGTHRHVLSCTYIYHTYIHTRGRRQI